MPNTHNIFHSAKMLKKHGTIFHIGEWFPVIYGTIPHLPPIPPLAEEKPIKLIIKAMPGIQRFVEDKLGEGAKVNGDSER